MALTNYGELLTAIEDWSTWTGATTQVPDFVTWAQEEIARRLRCNTMLASADLTLSAEVIAQPTGFEAFKRVYLDTTPRRRIETTSAEGAMDLAYEFASSTYPTHVAVEGTNLRFAPQFTSTTTVAKALYYKTPTVMTADADTNVIMTKYPMLYLFGALEALYRYKEDDNNADRFGAQFGALIQDINASEAKDAMSGPLQVQVAPGGVV